MADPLDILIKRWQQEATAPFPGERPEAVVAAFRQVGMQATPDVIALYGRIGGMEMMDNSLWRLWPLAEVVTGTDPSDIHDGVAFSDYLIDSRQYFFKPNASGGCAVYGSAQSLSNPSMTMIAPSLDTFLAMYVNHAEAMLRKD